MPFLRSATTVPVAIFYAARAKGLPPGRPTVLWASHRRTRGFTLLHLLSVITVLGALCALAAPALVPGAP